MMYFMSNLNIQPKLSKTLEILFPRKKKHRENALRILIEIRNRQYTDPYTADEYHDFCTRYSIKESDYQTALTKLRKCGLVEKKGGHHEGKLTLSDKPLALILLTEWHEFLKVT